MPNLIDNRRFSIYAFTKGTNEVVYWIEKQYIPDGMSGLDIANRLDEAIMANTWFDININQNLRVMFNTQDYSGFKLIFH